MICTDFKRNESLFCWPLSVLISFLILKGGLESGWISDRVQPAFRLWVDMVGSFVDSAFLQKRPAIEMIQIIWCFFYLREG